MLIAFCGHQKTIPKQVATLALISDDGLQIAGKSLLEKGVTEEKGKPHYIFDLCDVNACLLHARQKLKGLIIALLAQTSGA